ncbi:MAG: TolC family protein [Candidatus Krumholzibacteria bacterium]|jgi:outer membrane protein TolC|nr:TolC family protein [Candidatus Krumholzibacteria bacterium]
MQTPQRTKTDHRRTRRLRAETRPALLAAAAAIVTALPWGAAAAHTQDPIAPPAQAVALDLERAVSLALANDELLRQADAMVAAAEADLRAADSGRLPQINVGAEWTANLIKPAFFLPAEFAEGMGGATKVEMGRDNSLQGAISLTWNLWTAGRLGAAVGAARELIAAGQWQHAAVTDAVRFQATAAYLDALLAAQRVRIAEDALATTAEALRLARAGNTQGTVSRFDLLRAEVELVNREVPLIQARNAQQQTELMLARLCGLAPPVRLSLTDTLAAVTGAPGGFDQAGSTGAGGDRGAGGAIGPAVVDALVAAMRDRSPELHALRHQVAAGQQAVALARAARGPTVQLKGQYGLQAEWDNDVAPSPEERATSAGVGLAVTVPIFDGWQARAGIQGAEARLRRAELELARLDRDRELAVRQASLQLSSALAALAGRRESVALADEAHRLAAVRLENGLATPLERLDAEMALTQARVQLAESMHACNLARAAVALAVGGDPATMIAALSATATQEDLR